MREQASHHVQQIVVPIPLSRKIQVKPPPRQAALRNASPTVRSFLGSELQLPLPLRHGASLEWTL